MPILYYAQHALSSLVYRTRSYETLKRICMVCVWIKASKSAQEIVVITRSRVLAIFRHPYWGLHQALYSLSKDLFYTSYTHPNFSVCSYTCLYLSCKCSPVTNLKLFIDSQVPNAYIGGSYQIARASDILLRMRSFSAILDQTWMLRTISCKHTRMLVYAARFKFSRLIRTIFLRFTGMVSTEEWEIVFFLNWNQYDGNPIWRTKWRTNAVLSALLDFRQ